MRIALYVHPDLSDSIVNGGIDGARALARLAGQAISTIQKHGNDLDHVPVQPFPGGAKCAMSVYPNRRGVVIEIDPVGSALNGIGVVQHKRVDKKPATASRKNQGKSFYK